MKLVSERPVDRVAGGMPDCLLGVIRERRLLALLGIGMPGREGKYPEIFGRDGRVLGMPIS